MKRKLVFAFAVIGLMVASAKTYTVNLYSPAMLGAVELKPGAYTVEVKDSTAVLRQGKTQNEAPVKVETNGTKYGATTVRFAEGGGKMTIQEIRLGGTNTRLIFNQ